ncbi:ABC transporter substrate-binding protein, partial [Mesorhizobium sp. M7A.F.Ca.CA.002.09.1.1]
MEAGRQVHRPRTWAIALALAAIVSGCQSKGGVSEVLDPAAVTAPAGQNGAAGAGPVQATQSMGTGSTKVTMLLPLSAPGTAGENGRKMLDATKL